jgi:hypothetical protein
MKTQGSQRHFREVSLRDTLNVTRHLLASIRCLCNTVEHETGTTTTTSRVLTPLQSNDSLLRGQITRPDRAPASRVNVTPARSATETKLAGTTNSGTRQFVTDLIIGEYTPKVHLNSSPTLAPNSSCRRDNLESHYAYGRTSTFSETVRIW